MPKLIINQDSCDGCGVCVTICPEGVLILADGRVRVENPDACMGVKAKASCDVCVGNIEACEGCVICIKNCPTSSIEILE